MTLYQIQQIKVTVLSPLEKAERNSAYGKSTFFENSHNYNHFLPQILIIASLLITLEIVFPIFTLKFHKYNR